MEALERKLAREVQAVPTATQLNSLLEERLVEFEAESKVQSGRLNTAEATARQVSWDGGKKGRRVGGFRYAWEARTMPRRCSNAHAAANANVIFTLFPSYRRRLRPSI